MPERVADIFALWERGTAPLLSFDVAGILVTCHFFAPEEIEFSIDPGDVTGQDSLDAIAALLHELASAIKKPALLTPENLPKSPILRADPESDRVELLPPSPEQAG